MDGKQERNFRGHAKTYCYVSLQYTISGKKIEVAVKKIVSGEAVNQRGALANPSSLDLYYNTLA